MPLKICLLCLTLECAFFIVNVTGRKKLSPLCFHYICSNYSALFKIRLNRHNTQKSRDKLDFGLSWLTYDELCLWLFSLAQKLNYFNLCLSPPVLTYIFMYGIKNEIRIFSLSEVYRSYINLCPFYSWYLIGKTFVIKSKPVHFYFFVVWFPYETLQAPCHSDFYRNLNITFTVWVHFLGHSRNICHFIPFLGLKQIPADSSTL